MASGSILYYYLKFLPHMKLSWEDFYDNLPKKTFEYKEKRNVVSFPNIIESNVYVHCCNFISTIGRAISLTSTESLLLVENSLFYKCRNDNWATAIYAKQISECIINNVCGNDCRTTNDIDCHFNYIDIKENQRNMILNSAISQTYSEIKDADIILYHLNGLIRVNTINISNNECDHNAGIFIKSNINEEDCLYMKYSIFYNNTAKNSTCLTIRQVPSKWNLYSLNFIKNNADMMIISEANSIFHNCLFKDNTGSPIIFASKLSITCCNCKFESNEYLTSGFVIIDNPNNIESNYFIFSHILLNDCKNQITVKFIKYNILSIKFYAVLIFNCK